MPLPYITSKPNSYFSLTVFVHLRTLNQGNLLVFLMEYALPLVIDTSDPSSSLEGMKDYIHKAKTIH